MTQMRGQQQDRRLTLASYDGVGRVPGALTTHADQVFEGLEAADQVRARRIFAQLVGLGASTEDKQAEAERDRALITQYRFLIALSRQMTAQGDALAGIMLAFEALPDESIPSQRPYVLEAERSLYKALYQGRERRLPQGHEGYVSSAAFSPDGARGHHLWGRNGAWGSLQRGRARFFDRIGTGDGGDGDCAVWIKSVRALPGVWEEMRGGSALRVSDLAFFQPFRLFFWILFALFPAPLSTDRDWFRRCPLSWRDQCRFRPL
jgi:hypothetical protein